MSTGYNAPLKDTIGKESEKCLYSNQGGNRNLVTRVTRTQFGRGLHDKKQRNSEDSLHPVSRACSFFFFLLFFACSSFFAQFRDGWGFGRDDRDTRLRTTPSPSPIVLRLPGNTRVPFVGVYGVSRRVLIEIGAGDVHR